MERYLTEAIKKDLNNKLVLLSGPRQVGKTTLAKSLDTSFEYLNFDRLQDRLTIQREEWDHAPSTLILDEIHKMKNWKRWLKGIYDTEKVQKIIVTGSARLETFKKMGDSLAGRYFSFHLMPLDIKELISSIGGKAEEHLENLLRLSGFPEPYLSGSEKTYKRWRETHLDAILREDLLELETIKRIRDIASLVDLMKERVGSVLSHNSLREDLQTDDKTIKRWMGILEETYVFFKIAPYSKSIKGALLKAPKYYFYDIPRVIDESARFENLVALALYKEILFQKDVEGEDFNLHFVRNKQKQEIDFLITHNRNPIALIEVKLGDDQVSKHFLPFEKQISPKNKLIKIQIVKNLKRNFTTRDGIQMVRAAHWLEKIDFSKPNLSKTN